MAESIGSTLKQRREARHLSISQVAEQTRIRPHYLQALENDDLSAIPSMAQARGFLRIYTDFLGLNLTDLYSATRSVETPAPVPQAVPAKEPSAAPVSPEGSTPKSQPRPNFLSGLRDRFTHHASSETEISTPESISRPEPEPEPEVFVPVRIHEEPPAAPQEAGPSEPTEEPKPIAKPARAPRSSSRKASAKKPVRTRTKKSAAKTAALTEGDESGNARVKKKIAE